MTTILKKRIDKQQKEREETESLLTPPQWRVAPSLEGEIALLSDGFVVGEFWDDESWNWDLIAISPAGKWRTPTDRQLRQAAQLSERLAETLLAEQ